jgi:drug/metabolite transporter (DMT)-like permease
MIWIAVSIALVGALGYALGAALQQYEAVTQGASLKLVKRPRWWLGGVIGFTGACLHAVALAFAPLVIVQPVSVATLVFAVPFAALLHGRRPHRLEILGSVAVTVGLLGLILLVPHHDVPPHLTSRAAIGFIACVVAVVLVCHLLARGVTGPTRALVLSVGAGTATGSVSTFVRVVGGGLGGDLSRLVHWFTLAVPVLLVFAVVLLQKTYAVGYFGIAYAGVQVVDPITSVLAGVLLLGEPLPAGPAAAVPALLAAALLVVGTVLLGRLAPDRGRPQDIALTPAATPAPRPLSAASSPGAAGR